MPLSFGQPAPESGSRWNDERSQASAAPACLQPNAQLQSYYCYVRAGINLPQGLTGLSGTFSAQKPFVPQIEQGHSNGQLAWISQTQAFIGGNRHTFRRS
jgi:hypothetical protein